MSWDGKRGTIRLEIDRPGEVFEISGIALMRLRELLFCGSDDVKPLSESAIKLKARMEQSWSSEKDREAVRRGLEKAGAETKIGVPPPGVPIPGEPPAPPKATEGATKSTVGAKLDRK